MQLDVDAPHDIVDPFAGVFRLNRLLVIALMVALLGLCVQGYWLQHVALNASAHAFEIYPDGRAYFVEDRENRLLPRDYEAKYVAKSFVELLYGTSSAAVFDDLASALSMCSEELQGRLRAELQESGMLQGIRNFPGGVRSEVEFSRVQNVELTRRRAVVAVEARLSRFGLLQFDGPAADTRDLAVTLVMDVVRRSEQHPNGLTIVHVKTGLPAGLPASSEGGS